MCVCVWPHRERPRNRATATSSRTWQRAHSRPKHVHHRRSAVGCSLGVRLPLVVRVQTDHFRLHAPLRLAKHRQTEHAQRQPELRQHCGDDQYFPERIEHTEPHDAELQHRPVHRAEHQLVDAHRDEREPGHPEHCHQRKGHRMTGIGQVLGQGRRVLLVMYRRAGTQLPDHDEDVAKVVHDRDDGGAEHQDGQRGAVGGHVAPVQFTDERLLIEDRITVAEQRWTAEQRRRDPGEGHPALASANQAMQFIVGV